MRWKMKVCLDGEKITEKREFYNKMAEAFGWKAYGENPDSLWDLLAYWERPIHVVWHRSCLSKNTMGKDFEAILNVFEKIKKHDEDSDWRERFTYDLD
jgi:RNAse (barnase) inhibitor barstar